LILVALLVLLAPACAGEERERLILASTTSTEDSGLFDVLIPAFEAAYPRYTVAVIAVGTGEALALGRRKDVDVLLVHSPAAESAFVADGYGTGRWDVMYNDYVIVGPPSDPAGVRGLGDAPEALRRIAAAATEFVSRGDDSGTHRRERQLWAEAGVAPGQAWHTEAGLGMGDVLRLAHERTAYTLTDRATFQFLQDRLGLEVLVEGDERLFNQYGVIPVAGAENLAGARAFRDWITSPAGQDLIGQYGADRWDRPLFIPNAEGRATGPGPSPALAAGRATARCRTGNSA
jgi:tungstate transport system substrate-binding protein